MSFKVICGDSNWLWVAGGGTHSNIIKKINGSGKMASRGSHGLQNGRNIRGIISEGDYLYVVCKEDSNDNLSPRVIKVAKSNWTETSLTLTNVDTFSPNDAEGIASDGTYLYVGGSVQDGNKSWSALWKIDLSTFSITSSKRYTQTNPKKLEDFRNFTEVDPGNRIEVPTHNYLDFVARNDETAYLYYDYGTGHFSNFTHKLKMEWYSSAIGAKAYVYLLANSLNDAYALNSNNETYVGVCFYHAGTDDYRIVLEEAYSGTIYSDYYSCSGPNATYYIKVEKSGTTLNAYIYSDSDYSNLLDTLTLTLQADHSFRYLYSSSSYNDGNEVSIDCDVENLDIGEKIDDNGCIKAIVPVSSYLYLFCKKGITLKISSSDLSQLEYSYVIPESIGQPVTGLPYKRSDEDIYFACNGNYIFKIRLDTLERVYKVTEVGWDSLQGTIGYGDRFIVGALNKNELIKLDITGGVMSKSGDTLVLSTGTNGINFLWVSS